MKNQQEDRMNVVVANSLEAQPKIWVAPLKSVSTFSIAESTQLDSFPGDDGLGIFTQS